MATLTERMEAVEAKLAELEANSSKPEKRKDGKESDYEKLLADHEE